MAFELAQQSATLKTVTPRKESHGDSKVTAVSFGLKFTAPNTLLDHLSPTLRKALYMPVTAVQPELEGVDPDPDPPTPLLRTKGIVELDLAGTLEQRGRQAAPLRDKLVHGEHRCGLRWR